MWTRLVVAKILLIDDDENDRRAFLRVATYEAPEWIVEIAKDGQDALIRLGLIAGTSQACGLAPDLIFLDVNMEPISGFDVLSAIRRDHAIGATPIIIFSDSDSDETVARAYCSGANAYIRKPIDVDEFRRIIRVVQSFWFDLARRPTLPNDNSSAAQKAS